MQQKNAELVKLYNKSNIRMLIKVKQLKWVNRVYMVNVSVIRNVLNKNITKKRWVDAVRKGILNVDGSTEMETAKHR